MTDDLFESAARQQPMKRNPSAAKALPQELIRESLEIDESLPSGLRWRVRPRHHFKTERDRNTWNARYSGQPAGRKWKDSIYWRVDLNGVEYKNHRIVFLLANGTDPGSGHVDHISADLPLPNVASNLRIASNAENGRNRKTHINNTSGVPGVVWDKQYQKWRSQIMVNYKSIKLGRFTELADAIAARKAAEVRYFGEFAFAASQNLRAS